MGLFSLEKLLRAQGEVGAVRKVVSHHHLSHNTKIHRNTKHPSLISSGAVMQKVAPSCYSTFKKEKKKYRTI